MPLVTHGPYDCKEGAATFENEPGGPAIIHVIGPPLVDGPLVGKMADGVSNLVEDQDDVDDHCCIARKISSSEGQTHYAYFQRFGDSFVMPPGHTIVGVKIRVRAFTGGISTGIYALGAPSTVNRAKDYWVKLVPAGCNVTDPFTDQINDVPPFLIDRVVGDNKAPRVEIPIGISSIYQEYGGDTDLWNSGMTDADITTMGVAIAFWDFLGGRTQINLAHIQASFITDGPAIEGGTNRMFFGLGV